MKALNQILDNARHDPKRIVLCEGEDERVLRAAAKAAEAGIARVILVGAEKAVAAAARDHGVDVSTFEVVDPATSPLTESLAQALHALREKKGMTREQAESSVRDPLCFAHMLVREGHADGSVAGAVNTTADVVRNAIQTLGLAPGSSLVSSFFLMMLCQPFHRLKGGLIFADCGLMVDPDAEQLSQIALAAADSAETLLDEEPRVAMLSFSTSGSAQHEHVDRVRDAAQAVQQQRPELAIDEDVQLDAAIVPDIAEKKLPDSRVKGRANVLVFPNLNAGNIGYKMAERIGGADAIGPLLQGLNKPANDLSRGCSVDDIYHVIAVTSVQAQASEKCAGAKG
ncbi:phosphate acetyltransferase [Halomonas garicola]|uniref:phosphate acetyltransferase n=1 Tax=Halomonas garicola TaxID=1690008 RepID=UPI0028987457|nr:phosphate acetyltransferase [Halomonas garicola]